MKLHNKFLCSAGVVFLLGGASLFAAEQSATEVLNKAYKYVGSNIMKTTLYILTILLTEQI